jgi:hypothetical protein
MTKAGKKLIRAAKELKEALKCDHEWKRSTPQKFENRWACHKCGLVVHGSKLHKPDL